MEKFNYDEFMEHNGIPEKQGLPLGRAIEFIEGGTTLIDPSQLQPGEEVWLLLGGHPVKIRVGEDQNIEFFTEDNEKMFDTNNPT